jgi:hypothetical protein
VKRNAKRSPSSFTTATPLRGGHVYSDDGERKLMIAALCDVTT